MRLYDAHNHLQDDRFGGRQAELMSACVRAGVARMVVNGSCESDWPQVLALAKQYPLVLPSFGYHPWYIGDRTDDWQVHLTAYLDREPCAIGEIGLDRWKPDLSYDGQEEVFVWQLRLAAERDRPVSIHCLRAWGRLLTLLQTHPRPARGFLLHSYGGPAEMVLPLARLGAYFGFPGYFARPNKERQRQVFRGIPPDRLLIETDAPDQPLPDSLNRHPFMLVPPDHPPAVSVPVTDAPAAPCPQPANHPANLAVIYDFVAQWLGEPAESLAARVESNFQRLFGRL